MEKPESRERRATGWGRQSIHTELVTSSLVILHSWSPDKLGFGDGAEKHRGKVIMELVILLLEYSDGQPEVW